jgi:hypothetical protein
MTFDASERCLLARLADELIPAGGGFPAASEAGVAEEGLDLVLRSRPDLADGLKEVLAKAKDRDPKAFIDELRVEDASGFGALAELAPGAYFLNAAVRARLGYDGQTPRPVDPHPDYLDDGLLQSVIDRGPIFRPTPRD